MSTEENKAVVRRFYEEVNQRNLAVVDGLFAPNYMVHTAGLEDRDLEGVKQTLTEFLTAFPDMHVRVEDMVGEGDKVVIHVTLTGTHEGEFEGIAPTGRQVTLAAMSIIRVDGGKMAEEWEIGDLLGLMQQIGAVPSG